jgi:hypothetical protein
MPVSIENTVIRFNDNSTQSTAASPSSYTGARGQVFTSSGTYAVPAGITSVKAIAVGGGGGSAICANANGNGGNASGGSINAAGTPGISQGGDPPQGMGGSSGGSVPALSFGAGGAQNILLGPFGNPQGFGSGGNSAVAAGGGGASLGYLTGLTPGGNIGVTVGGAGNNTNLNNGNAGGASSFSGLTANGGNAGSSGFCGGIPVQTFAGTAGIVIIEW